MPVSQENGLDIYYEVTGAGPPLVLIHALPFDHNLWLYQVERFSARFRTIAMDLRGWGRSDKPRTPFTLRDMGNDVLGVLADAGVAGGAIVIGCSIGSKIGLMLACDHPAIFRTAILVGGTVGLPATTAHCTKLHDSSNTAPLHEPPSESGSAC
jgi:pimeloyl-ACP methyl ester carboxylesterase